HPCAGSHAHTGAPRGEGAVLAVVDAAAQGEREALYQGGYDLRVCGAREARVLRGIRERAELAQAVRPGVAVLFLGGATDRDLRDVRPDVEASVDAPPLRCGEPFEAE